MSALRPLRILEIATSGSVGTADMGPVSETVWALANGFAKRGHSVTVADLPAINPRSRLDPRIDVVAVPVVNNRLRRLTKLTAKVHRLYDWGFAFRYLWSLNRRLQLKSFDIVHVHDESLACLLSVFMPRRFYYTSHTSVWALKRAQGEMLSAGEQIDALVESFAIRNSRTTIALADYLATQFSARARIQTIPHGIEAERWQRLDRAQSRAALQIDARDFVAVFVGRLHPQKGLDILIEAVKRVAPDRPRLQLFVIGSAGGHYSAGEQPSEYAVELIRLAVGTPIRFVGFLEHDSIQLRQYLSAADVAIAPSRHEPFGYVALEALAMSLPVIASRTGGLAQTVSEDVGLLVEPGDAAALAAAICSLHDDPEGLDALRDMCRARVEQHYTRKDSVARHLVLFTQDAPLPVLRLETSR